MTEEKILLPIDPEWPEARVCAKIDFWRASGVPWEAIAGELGVPDKRTAKRLRRHLEHQVRLRQLAG